MLGRDLRVLLQIKTQITISSVFQLSIEDIEKGSSMQDNKMESEVCDMPQSPESGECRDDRLFTYYSHNPSNICCANCKFPTSLH